MSRGARVVAHEAGITTTHETSSKPSSPPSEPWLGSAGKPIGLAGVLGVHSLVTDWLPDKTDWLPDREELAGLTELRRLVLRMPAGTPVPELPGVTVTVPN